MDTDITLCPTSTWTASVVHAHASVRSFAFCEWEQNRPRLTALGFNHPDQIQFCFARHIWRCARACPV